MRRESQGRACQGCGAPGGSLGPAGDGLLQRDEAARRPARPVLRAWTEPLTPAPGWRAVGARSVNSIA
jgi:hypothetical protein